MNDKATATELATYYMRGYQETGNIDHLREARVYAAIAQAEAAQRQAAAMERIADYIEGYVALYLDNSILTVAEERQARRLTA